MTPKLHVTLVVGVVMVAGCRGSRQDPPSLPTFNRDIAPIVLSNCAPCHRPGQMAPFSLVTFADVKPRAARIADVTAERFMPPWLPEPGYGDFSNRRRLTDEQIATIKRWVDTGSTEGAATDKPTVPAWPEGWQLGTPDLVVALPEPYVLQAGEGDVFRNFVLPVALPSTRFIRGVEFRPGNAKVVHHVVIGVDPTAGSRRLDAADPGPGFDGMLAQDFRTPGGHFLSWTPGKLPYLDPPDMGWRLEPGTDIVLQMHMLPAGESQQVQPEIGFFFTDQPPGRIPVMLKLSSTTIDIPPGDSDYAVTDSYTLPADVDVWSIYPHAHYLGKEMKAFATLPGGEVRWLLWIKQWDFHWQDLYRYSRPVSLPRGTTITMRYTYDNAGGNRHHSGQPPRRVVYGAQSSDEMGDLWLQVLPRQTADVDVLARDNRRREIEASLAAAEKMARDRPADASAHNFLGATYLQVSRVADATAELREAVRLNPAYAEAHNNLGEALRARGNLDQAIRQFRRATDLRPNDDGIRLNLAEALKSAGRLEDAVREYRKSIAINPTSPEAHNNLGTALGALNRVAEASGHFQTALTLRPNYFDAHNNMAIALGAQGRFDDAVRHATLALQLRPNNPDARTHLEELARAAARARASTPRP